MVRVRRPQVKKYLECHYFPSVLWHCWLGDRKDIRPVKRWVLVCWWWRLDWSFAHLVAPVVNTTSTILAPVKFTMVSFWYQLIGLSWKKTTRWGSLSCLNTTEKLGRKWLFLAISVRRRINAVYLHLQRNCSSTFSLHIGWLHFLDNLSTYPRV